jgi:hypothetical protein
MPTCAYCGSSVSSKEKEHVVPRCLYPASKSKSKVQRLTIPACSSCNRGWSSDEAHFRNMLLIAGQPNDSVYELWRTTVHRSFHEVDGRSRATDLFLQMVPAEIGGRARHKVYPGKDERVVRVVRKVIRGLCHHHGLATAVPDHAVFADVLVYEVPEALVNDLPLHHRELDIFNYRYSCIDDGQLHSGWLLTFFESRVFVGCVAPRRSWPEESQVQSFL